MRVLGRASRRVPAPVAGARRRGHAARRAARAVRATCSACTSELIATRGRAGTRRDPATLARYGELQERYQREGGYELEARVRRLTDRRRLRRGGPRAFASRRCRAASAAAWSWRRCWCGSPICCCSTSRPTTWIWRPSSGSRASSPSTRARSCWSRTTAPSSAPCAARSSSSRTASSSATRSATTSTSSSATRASSARAPPTSARRSTSTRPRTSSAATSPGRRPSRRRAGARCSRSWIASSAPTTSWEHAGKIALSFQTGGDLGSKETIRAPKLDGRLPGRRRRILRDVTANIYRGDKVGIVGPNGGGKSTLLKTLIGELPPLAGKVEIGTGVRIGYFDQKLGTLDEDLSLIDEIRSVRADLSPEVVAPVPGEVPLLRRRPVPHRARPLGRRAQPAGDGEDHALPAQRAGARRADQPPRHPGARDAGGGARRLRGDADRHQPRPLLPRPRLHPPAGHRRRPRWRRTSATTATGGAASTNRSGRRRPRRPPPKPAAKAPSAAAASRDADKDRDRDRRRLARRVETLEADVSKLEAELAAVRAELAGRSRRATGRSCTHSPTARGSSTPCWPGEWPNGKRRVFRTSSRTARAPCALERPTRRAALNQSSTSSD